MPHSGAGLCRSRRIPGPCSSPVGQLASPPWLRSPPAPVLLHTRVLPLAASLAAASAACAPSPDRLKDELVKHPEIVLAAIEAHPTEFIAALQKAAAQNGLGPSPAAEQRRLDEEFAHSKAPAITRRAVLGNPTAPVTIVEYSDFQCPFCREEREVLVQLMREYGDSVRLVVKHTPLAAHPVALPAALMYEAIARQDPMAAYRFYDELFAHQERLDAEGEPYLAVARARRERTRPARAGCPESRGTRRRGRRPRRGPAVRVYRHAGVSGERGVAGGRPSDRRFRTDHQPAPGARQGPMTQVSQRYPVRPIPGGVHEKA